MFCLRRGDHHRRRDIDRRRFRDRSIDGGGITDCLTDSGGFGVPGRRTSGLSSAGRVCNTGRTVYHGCIDDAGRCDSGRSRGRSAVRAGFGAETGIGATGGDASDSDSTAGGVPPAAVRPSPAHTTRLRSRNSPARGRALGTPAGATREIAPAPSAVRRRSACCRSSEHGAAAGESSSSSDSGRGNSGSGRERGQSSVCSHPDQSIPRE